MKNVALGQYYPGNSVIHRLDPRTKIIITLALFVVIFMIDTFIGFACLGALFCVLLAMSRIKVGYVMQTVRPLLFRIIITFALNIFFYRGETVWFEYGVIVITQEGLIKALFMAIRLLLLIMSTSLMMLTTTPVQLTDGLEKLAAPLAKMGAHVHEMAMMMSIALRFIPTLNEETERIQKAQTARGAEFDSGNVLARAKNMIPLLVPLFVSAFKRADELAMAMEARCYHGGKGRTKLKILVMQRNDWIALAVILAACVVMAVLL